MNQSVQEIVGLVSASGALGKTKRQRELLHYLLAQKERGRLDGLMQYSIAFDVLGRPDNFDPSTDSIVRVEMHRLRKNLLQFNATSKTVQLTIPRASYEVVVTDKAQNEDSPFLKTYYKPLIFATTALAAMTFGVVSFTPQKSVLSASASSCSSTMPNLSVINSGSSADLQIYVGKIIRSSLSQYTSIKLVENINDCSNSGTPSFTLDYMVFEENGTYSVALTTYNEQASDIVSFKNISGVVVQLDDKDDLYYAVVKTIGDLTKPYGTIPRYAMTKEWKSKEVVENYGCLITMYDSFTTDSDEDYTTSLACLELSIESDVVSLDNLGGLAASYIEQAQQYRSKITVDPLARAGQLIDKAGSEWTNNVEMVVAKIMYEVERPDYNVERLESILNIAEKNYDGNPQVLLVVAIYSGFKIGNWERAKLLSDRVKRIHSETDNSVYLVDAAYALLNETPTNIMQTCSLTYSQKSLFSNLIIDGCSRYAQDIVWNTKTNDNLNRMKYITTTQKVEYIQNRNYDPVFSKQLISALQTSIN